MDIAELLLVIGGENAGGMRVLGETQAGMAGLRAEAASTNGGLASLAGTLAKVGMAVGAVAAVIGVTSVKMAADLQKTMMLVRTQAHDTTDNLDQMTSKVIDLSTQVGVSADKLAEGLYHITSVGYRGAEAMDILKIAAEGARVGNADLDSTTYALTSTMQTYGLTAEHAQDTMATLNAIVGAGDMRFQDLNAAISTGFLAAGDTFGVTIQSMGAALAYLTDRGASADESATRLKMSINLLGAPTSKAVGILKDLGLSAEEATGRATAMEEALKKSGVTTTQLSQDLRQPDGIMVALQDLVDHMHKGGLSADEMAAVLSRAFGGGRSGAAIMSMVEHLDILKSKFDTVNAGASRFGQDWADTQKTFNFQLDHLRTNVEALALRLGNRLLPALTDVVTYLADHVSAIQGWIDGFDHLLNRIAVFASGAAGLGGQLVGGVQSTQPTDAGHGVGQAPGPTTTAVRGLGGAAERRLSEGGGAASAQPGVFVTGEGGPVSTIQQSTANLALGHEIASSILKFSGEIATALVSVMQRAAEMIDWTAVGIGVGERAGPFIVGLIGTMMDPIKMGNAAGDSIVKHPTEWFAVASTIVAIIFAPVRFAALIGEFLGRVPIVGPMLRWMVLGLNALGGPIRSLFSEWGRTVFSKALADALERAGVVVDLSKGAGGILRAIQSLFDGIGIRFLRSADVVRGAISHLIDLIGTQFWIGAKIIVERFWNELKLVWEAWGGKELPGLLNEFRGFFGELFSLFGRAASWVSATVVRLISDLRGWFVTGFLALLGIVSGWVDGIIGWFEWLWHRVVGASIIPDLVNAIIGWFKGLATQVFAIVDGWVNSLIARFGELKDGLLNMAKQIASGLIDFFGGGLNSVLALFRGFLDALSKIPGIGALVPDANKVLGNIDLGALKKTIGLATGGMITNGPQYLVGEGNPAHPEVVLPTDPAHRGRALDLLGWFTKTIGLAGGGVMGNPYPGGECTWYVYSRFPNMPVNGNATDWGGLHLEHSSKPAPGEVVVYHAGPGYSQYGHVAVVEEVLGDKFRVSEMNYVGHGVVSSRISSMAGVETFLKPGVPGAGSPASGTSGGGPDLMGLIEDALKAAQGGLNAIPQWIRGFAGTMLGKISDSAKAKLLTSLAGTSASGTTPVSGNVTDWIHQAEKLDGVGDDWTSGLQQLVSKESGGDPKAHNDSGASGIAQMKPGTFSSHWLAGHHDIWNPVDNLASAIRYIQATYGNPGHIPNLFGRNYVGYDAGGTLMPGLTMALNNTGRPETVLPPGAGLSGEGAAALGIKLDRTNDLLYQILTDSPVATGFTAGLRAG